MAASGCESIGRAPGRRTLTEQLGNRLSSLDEKISRVREHVLAVDPSIAESLGFYDQAKQLAAERQQVQADLTAAGPEPELPALPDLRQRIHAEFDHMEALMASGTLEERRTLVGCYVAQIKTKPEEATVCIGFLSGLSQMVEHSGRWSSLLSVRRAFRTGFSRCGMRASQRAAG